MPGFAISSSGVPESTNPLPCSEQLRLMDAWGDKTREFSDALDSLRLKMGTVSKQEYNRLKNHVEGHDWRPISARRVLEVHRNNHGC